MLSPIPQSSTKMTADFRPIALPPQELLAGGYWWFKVWIRFRGPSKRDLASYLIHSDAHSYFKTFLYSLVNMLGHLFRMTVAVFGISGIIFCYSYSFLGRPNELKLQLQYRVSLRSALQLAKPDPNRLKFGPKQQFRWRPNCTSAAACLAGKTCVQPYFLEQLPAPEETQSRQNLRWGLLGEDPWAGKLCFTNSNHAVVKAIFKAPKMAL